MSVPFWWATRQPTRRNLRLADLLFDVAECFIIEFPELLHAIDFLPDLHFVEGFVAPFWTALLYFAETKFTDALQDAGLLDAA